MSTSSQYTHSSASMGPRTTNTGGVPAAAPSTESTEWELGVAYILHSWAALSMAVNSQWGGPNSAEKRDWLCGAVTDMFDEAAAANTGVELDEYDVEETLAQVMVDEFGVDVQDESILPIAQKIVKLRGEISRGDFAWVEVLREAFEKGKGKYVVLARAGGAQIGGEDGDDDDAEEEEAEGEDGDSDEEMRDVDAQVYPPLSPNTASAGGPQGSGQSVDEDGFELVQNGRRGKRKGGR